MKDVGIKLVMLHSWCHFNIYNSDLFHMWVSNQSFEMKSIYWNFEIPDSLKTSKTNFYLRFSGTISRVPMPAKRNFEVSN